jgi:acetyl-CoA carboxylase biotin carboxyl carrier protein
MGPRERSLLDLDVLRQLLHGLASTDVDEIEVSQGGARLYVRRAPDLQAIPQREERPGETAEGVAVRAPLAGVLYTRPSPEEPAFVAVGDRVEPGQVVALIETMKLFNEVTVEVAGEVVSLTVADGDLVEAGQPLLYVRPQEGGSV